MNHQRSQPGFIAAFFSFERMVSPFFIGLIYFIGLAGIIVITGMEIYRGQTIDFISLGLAIAGINLPPDILLIVSYLVKTLGGLLLILFWRFSCELLIVLFAIYQLVDEINDALHQRLGQRPVSDPAIAIPMPAPKPDNPPAVDKLPKIARSKKPVELPDDLPPLTPGPAPSGSSKGWRIRRRRR